MLRASSADARSTRAKRRRLHDARQQLRGLLGREPTGVELAARLGLSIAELHRLSDEAAPTTLESMEERYSDSDRAFAADTPDAETVLLQHEDRAALVTAIAALPERLQLVVQLYFVEEMNLAEIAAVLDVSVPRVHQLKSAALARLRAALAPGT